MRSELNFEKPLIELQNKISELKIFAEQNPEIDLSDGLKCLESDLNRSTKKAFGNVTRWQTVWLARHEKRPQSPSYIEAIFDSPIELYGDKIYADDRALIGGLAWFDGNPIVYLAQQKGRDLKERQAVCFGHTHPEGYRKALRLMRLAEKFDRPLICIVDTPGAHFDRGSEERGQSIAIAENLAELAKLRVPIVVVMIGEGGSGGALAIAVGDRVLMLENAIYCVAPPEACSGIVWKDNGEHAPDAADALKPLAKDLIRFGIIDEVIAEPIGGAHRDADQAIEIVRSAMLRHLNEIIGQDREKLIDQRYRKYRKIGVFGENFDQPKLTTTEPI